MTLYVTESEMIERFSDSLKEASSRCKELVVSEEKDKPEIFVKLAHSLKVGAGSAHQLSMAQENPKFLFIRDVLEKFLEFATVAVFKEAEAPIWTVISNELDKLAENGHKMATSKALTRQEVLKEIDNREMVFKPN